MIDIYNISLLDLIPDSLKHDSNVRAICEALTPEVQAVANDIQQCVLLPRIGELPEKVQELLARQLHVDFYDGELSLETKRELVKNSVRWHKRKGTPGAVEELVSTVFGEGTVEEWFEYGGEPYYFKVKTPNIAATNEDAEKFIRTLNSVKNARSWLEKVEITVTESFEVFLAGVIYDTDRLTVEQVV